MCYTEAKSITITDPSNDSIDAPLQMKTFLKRCNCFSYVVTVNGKLHLISSLKPD